MRKLLVVLILLTPMGLFAETFDELLDSIDTPLVSRFENGVIYEMNLVTRVIQISGYDYHVSPAFGEDVTEISLLGTSAGALELLSVGMKVEVEYLDLERARVAIVIKALDQNLEVEF
ncbi:MAG: hypothetical protein VCA12_20860 [Pseudomonadales bacterium]